MLKTSTPEIEKPIELQPELTLKLVEVAALYKILKFHYINYENITAVEVVRKMDKFLQENLADSSVPQVG